LAFLFSFLLISTIGITSKLAEKTHLSHPTSHPSVHSCNWRPVSYPPKPCNHLSFLNQAIRSTQEPAHLSLILFFTLYPSLFQARKLEAKEETDREVRYHYQYIQRKAKSREEKAQRIRNTGFCREAVPSSNVLINTPIHAKARKL
jgi:hypothetical protein